jgi:hypothetical protein
MNAAIELAQRLGVTVIKTTEARTLFVDLHTYGGMVCLQALAVRDAPEFPAIVVAVKVGSEWVEPSSVFREQIVKGWNWDAEDMFFRADGLALEVAP